MVRNSVRSAAVLVAVLLWALGMSACVIRLGKGDGSGETVGTSDDGGGAGGEANTPGEQEDPFRNADVAEINRQGLKASATAYLTEGMIEQGIELRGIAPDSIDAATAQQLLEDTWPAALEQAETWISTLDSSAFDAQLKPPSAYCTSLGCPTKTYCDSKFHKKTVTCYQQACGDGGCTACPDWFGPLKHIVATAWCSYVCMDGETVIGSAALVVTRWDNYQMCIVP